MTSESKAKNVAKIISLIELEEANYDRLSMLLIQTKIRDKDWEKITSEYNVSATKIHFLNKQKEIVIRTGKMLGDSEEYDYQIYGKHFYAD